MRSTRILLLLTAILAFPLGIYHGLKRSDTALLVYKSIKQLTPSSTSQKPTVSQDQLRLFSESIRSTEIPVLKSPGGSLVPSTAPQLLRTRNSFDFRNISVKYISQPQLSKETLREAYKYTVTYENHHHTRRSVVFSCKKQLSGSKKLLVVMPGSGEGESDRILAGTSHYQSNYPTLFGLDYNLCVLPRPSESLSNNGISLVPVHNLYQLNFIERGTSESVIHLNDFLALVYSIRKYHSSIGLSLAGISAGGKLVIASSLINDPILDSVDFHSFSGFSLLHLFYEERIDLNQPIIPGLYEVFLSKSPNQKLQRTISLYYGVQEDDLYGLEAKSSFTCREAARLFSQLSCFKHTGGHNVPKQAILSY